MPAFAALVERHGLSWAKRLFSAWAGDTRHDTPPWLASLPRLCEVLTAGGEHGRALAPRLLSGEVARFRRKRVDQRRLPAAFAEELAGRHLDDIVALLAAAAAIPAPAIRDDIVAVLVGPGTALPLATAGALLRKVHDGRTPAEVRALGLEALYGHVVDALAAALAAPERSPDDWTIEPPTGCDCALCRELASFLRDRERTRRAWPLAEQQRRHVHEVIGNNRLPVSHTTIREGRPYTLVLTKQAALFEREAAERTRRRALLTWLEGQRGAFMAAPGPTRSRTIAGTRSARTSGASRADAGEPDARTPASRRA
jgi:hypothetical protein